MGIRRTVRQQISLPNNVNGSLPIHIQRALEPIHSPACDNEPVDDPAPVRITFEQGSAAAVNRRFIGGFFAFAILFAGAAFYRPAIQAFAIGFPIYLVMWKLRLRRTSRPGWALIVSSDQLILEAGARSARIQRLAADTCCFQQVGSRTKLLVLNGTIDRPFGVEIDDSDREEIALALTAAGPLQNCE